MSRLLAQTDDFVVNLQSCTYRYLKPRPAQESPYTAEVNQIAVVTVLMVEIVVKAHNVQIQQHHQMIAKKKSMR